MIVLYDTSHMLRVYNGIRISNAFLQHVCIFIYMYFVRWKQIELNWIKLNHVDFHLTTNYNFYSA